MKPSNKLSKEQILAALARLNELLHGKGVMAAAVCDLVSRYYKESLLPPRVRFYIEELIGELEPQEPA